jgi:hypothetical protein
MDAHPWTVVVVHTGGATQSGWFSAYARDWATRRAFASTFVQVMCDLGQCMEMISRHEVTMRGGLRFETLSRLRLDLAWEVPLRMPTGGLLPNTVHTPRMNTKAGINDKWAIGLREPMEVYLRRVEAMAVANRLFAPSHGASASTAGLFWMHKQGGGGESMSDYECKHVSQGQPMRCLPIFDRHTEWQRRVTNLDVRISSRATLQAHAGTDATGASEVPTLGTNQSASVAHDAAHAHGQHLGRRRFSLTSESFLQWALWRRNVSVAYEPSWMFCKMKLSNLSQPGARTCVPRMVNRTRCASLVCTGSGVDCGCRADACTYFDHRARRNATHWYCQDTVGGQLGLNGEVYT